MNKTDSLIFILLIVCNLSIAQSNNYIFKRISEEEGLTPGAIGKITQDGYGNIWLGTNYGLIRYDSKKFKRFTHIPGDKQSIIHNVVKDIAIDKQNLIWVLTRVGLCYFNHTTQTFTEFKVKTIHGKISIINIQSINIDKNGNIWLLGNDIFGIVNKETQKFTVLKTLENEIPRSIYCDENGIIWMGTLNGSLYKINPELFSSSRIVKGSGIKAEKIFSKNNHLWVSYGKNGLKHYSGEGKLLNTYTFNKGNKGGGKSEAIRKITIDKTGKLWVATYGGLYLKENDSFRYFNPEIYTGLFNATIYDIFQDKEGGLWVGTWSGGLSYYHPDNNEFGSYSKSTSKTISSNVVSSFAQDKTGFIYIGTETGGLNLFDKKKGTFQKVNFSGLDNITSIKTQCFDKFGGHWIGTFESGLWYKPPGKLLYKNFTSGLEDGNHVSHCEIYTLFPVPSGIWIGTNGGGINFYDFKTQKINFYKPSFGNKDNLNRLFVRALCVDSDSFLWIGTIGGIHRISLETGKEHLFFASPQLPNLMDYIYSISELSNGQVWIGTRGSGIGIFNKKDNTISHFDADGLIKGKNVYSIIDDKNGNLWIAVCEALIFYNPTTRENHMFTANDGLQKNWFNPQAVYKDDQHNLYFGGSNGFSVIFPDKIKKNTRPPEVTINKITINNNIEKYPYFRANKQDNKLELAFGENTIKIDFTSDNFLLPKKNKYKYRLVNYFNKWIETDQETSAFFVNLPWGNYTFEVLTCNNDGVWSEGPLRFNLIVLKPLYASNMALSGYFLLLTIISIIIFRVIRMRSSLKNQVFIERIQRKQEKDLNMMKLKFFTNISHEFRTPLSLISGPIKNLGKSSNLSEQQSELVDVIWRNTKRLLALVNQVIDLRKIDQHDEKLKPKKTDIVSFVRERTFHFSNQAKEMQISFEQDYSNSIIEIEIDNDMVDKIVFNLLSNAFKYTPKNGFIKTGIYIGEPPADFVFTNQISFGEQPKTDFISICVTDNGLGIDKHDMIKIFNRFEQGKITSRESSGIGLAICHDYSLLHNGQIEAQSNVGNGSRFIVRLPLKQAVTKDISMSQKPYTQHETEANISIIDKEKTTGDLHKKHVLVVDDNADFRNYLEIILSEHYKVILAENGKIALDSIANNIVDIVVSDVMMPEMDGYELCTNIKNNTATSHIPIILLTALSSINHEIFANKKEADAYILKPFDDDLLITKIANVLKQRQNLRTLFSPKAYTGSSDQVEGLDNYFLKKLNGIIEHNLANEEFSIVQLTQEIGISRSQLHRKLKSMTNYSTTEYIRVYRVEKAVALMQTSDHNMDEISFLVGFNTHSYFSRSFKKRFGMTPKEYKKRML
ncbi:MAG: hypothetical protein COB98_02285 [Flavobacteriaceae bacterium]|nr:MAG: hypothetical protein COB98_02285 [Flavobacteriaceae bacterium]